MTEPSLATLARRELVEARIARGTTMLLACSGGLDSQVLLDVLAHVARPARGRARTAAPLLRLYACGIDHGLRAEAPRELAVAADLAAARGVPFRAVRVSVAHGSNVQARARDQRYAALRAVAREVGASYVATGHHLGDRAETVLLRILRGAPLPGLAVLPPLDGDLFRPLIRAPKARLEVHARDRGLAFAADPSNLDRRYARVRVREEVVPLLRSLDPRIVEHLAQLADGACAYWPRAAVATIVGTEGGASSSEESQEQSEEREGTRDPEVS